MSAERSVWRVKAVAEAEPGALVRVLQMLELRNVVPCHVTAQRVPVRGRSMEMLEIEIEVMASDLAPEALRVIAAKIAELPMILSTVVTDKIGPHA